jgi:hypothetical protein
VTPDHDVPAVISQVWNEILGTDSTRTESFFEQGGTSLSAALLISRASRRLGRQLSMVTFIARPYLADLIESAASGATGFTITAAPAEGGRHPVTANQAARLARVRRARRSGETDWNSLSHLIVVGYTVRGELDPDRLSRAVDWVVDRHQGLRTAFDWEAEQQWVVADNRPTLEVVKDARERAWEALRLDDGRLARFLLTAVEPGRWELWMSLEHIVADRPSVRAVLADLRTAYDQGWGVEMADRQPAPTQNHTAAFTEDAFCRSAEGIQAREHWTRVLGGRSPWVGLSHPAVREVQDDEGRRAVRHVAKLDTDAAAAITATALKDGTTWLSVALVALATAVGSANEEPEVGVLVPLSNRELPGFDDVVSFLTNIVPVLVTPDLCGDPADRLRAGRNSIIEALRNASYPMHRLTRETVPDEWGQFQRRPFLYLDVDLGSGDEFGLDGCQLLEVVDEPESALWGLAAWVEVRDSAVEISMTHQEGFLSREAGAGLFEAFHRHLVEYAAIIGQVR